MSFTQCVKGMLPRDGTHFNDQGLDNLRKVLWSIYRKCLHFVCTWTARCTCSKHWSSVQTSLWYHVKVSLSWNIISSESHCLKSVHVTRCRLSRHSLPTFGCQLVWHCWLRNFSPEFECSSFPLQGYSLNKLLWDRLMFACLDFSVQTCSSVYEGTSAVRAIT